LAFTLSLPIKDFKDIEGDKKYGIWTIPVIFGEDRARLIVAAGIFISFVASVFFLNALNLFFWAIAFGGGAFLILINKKIKTTNLFWWMLVLVFLYGLILLKGVFFS
jgi:4-hydroxybenzoate polyprenyltransferase